MPGHDVHNWTVPELAARWRTTPETLRKRIRRHEIEAMNLGTVRRPRWLVPDREVRRLESNTNAKAV